jgi:hypothetical protein
MENVYPPQDALKIIAAEGSGGTPEKVVITAPAIVKPGESFSLKIAVTDRQGLAPVGVSGSLEIWLEDIRLQEIRFPQNEPALVSAETAVIRDEGFYRFRGVFQDRTFYSNPVYCSSTGGNIFWGDPHIHTALSNCNAQYSRSCTFAYYAARYLSCLDWITAADHVSGGRCELARWKEESAISDLHNDAGRFVTLPGYEESLKGGAGGDNNVYMTKFPSMFVDEFEGGNTLTLVQELEKQAEEEQFDFFIVPHHTTRTVKHGEITGDIYPGPERMPLVEIHSKWGTSEYRGNPTPLHKIHPGPSYSDDLLHKGLPLGFMGGTDTHATLTFGTEIEPGHIDRPAGITGVYCEDLTRQNIFKALKNRSCYAVKGERIFLEVKVNGSPMGSILKDDGSGRILTWKAAAAGNIRTVEIIRNGEVIHREEPENWHTQGGYRDNDTFRLVMLNAPPLDNFIYYYIRLTCVSGAMAWSSPVWVTA